MKIFKKLFATTLALSLAATLMLGFASCGGDEGDGGEAPHTHTYASEWTKTADGHFKACTCHPESITVLSHKDGADADNNCDECGYEMQAPVSDKLYSVTVIDDEGNPVVGAEVLFQGFGITEPVTTNASGIASLEVETALGLQVSVSRVPEAYMKTQSKSYAFQSGEKTITISDVEKLVLYTLLVTDEYGDPVEGVKGQICTGSDCRPGTTDVSGKIYAYLSKAAIEANGAKALVTALPDGYANPEGTDVPFDYVDFASGEATVEIVIISMTRYTVSATDFYGNALSGIAVELYDASNSLVASAKTNEQGVASFDLTPMTYTLDIKHCNGAFRWINKESNTVDAKNSSYVASFIESTGRVEYEFNIYGPDGNPVKDGEVFVFDKDLNVIWLGLTVTTDKTFAAVNTPNKDYYVSVVDGDNNYAFVELKKDGPSNVDIHLTEAKMGVSAENAVIAFVLDDLPFMENDLNRIIHPYMHEFEAGESLYVRIPDAHGFLLSMDAEGFEVEYNGESLPVDGEGKFTHRFVLGKGEDAIIKITAKTAATLGHVSVKHPGSKADPYYLVHKEINGLTRSESFYEGETKYFNFWSSQSYTLIVTAEGADISINGKGSKYVTQVSELVDIAVTSKTAGDIDISFVYEERTVDYTVNATSTEVSSLEGYEVSIYSLVGDEYTLVASAVTDADGNAVFEGLVEAANYYVAVTSVGFIKDYIKVESSDEPTTVVIAHERDGSKAYPYYVQNGENTVSVGAGDTKWCVINVIGGGSYTLKVDDDNLLLSIYILVDGEEYLLSLNGEYKFADYGVDATVEGEYTFSNYGVYRLAFTARNSAEDEFVFNYVSNAKTKDNAIVLTEKGDVTVAIKNGETDYYKLSLTGTVTVTVNGMAAISKITATELGDVTESVDGSSFTVTLTEESEVYFRLSSTVDGEVTVTIS